jgi:hypothetical protein
MTPRTQETCSICLDTIDNLFVTNCGHYFHKHCIDRWLNTNDNCPLCRTINISVEEVYNYTYTEEINNNNNTNNTNNTNNINNINIINNINYINHIHDTVALYNYLNNLLSNIRIDDTQFSRLNEAIAVNDMLEQILYD